MDNRIRRKHKNKKLANMLFIPLFFIMAFAAVRIGIMSGDYLSTADAKIVRSIDIDNYKTALNKSFPVIDTVYNSGKISISLSGEIKNIVKGIFGFELNSPITILNAQSPLFNNFYNTGYKTYLAEQLKKELDDINENEQKIAEYDPGMKRAGDLAMEDSSSISYDDEEEVKDPSKSDTVSEGRIIVDNQTNYNIDIDKLLKEPLNLHSDRKGPSVLIFHTHTTESYLRNPDDLKKADVPSWSSDERYNVVRVGAELAQNLRKKYGIEVTHNALVHDYPSYNSAYGRSLNTVDKILKSYPSIKVVIDIHRDGLSNGQKLRTATTINGKSAAKVMFVVGSNSDRLPHPKWQENLKLALKLQQSLNEKYPELGRYILISTNRYNQHLSEGAMIIEIGADGDTLDEALETARYLADVIGEVIK